MIISVLGEKGGTGKTTLATNLAAIRATGSDLILLDADRQGSSSFWVQERRRQRMFLGLPVFRSSDGVWPAKYGTWPVGMTT